MLTKYDFRIGQAVKFNHKGEILHAVITKLNPKRAKVQLEKGGMGNVPYRLLTDSTRQIEVKPETTGPPPGLTVGQEVIYQAKGNEYCGVIEKLNPKRAKVRHSDGHIWLVPYSFLTENKVTVSIQISPEQYEQFRKAMVEMGVTTDQVLQMAIDSVIEHKRIAA